MEGGAREEEEEGIERKPRGGQQEIRGGWDGA